MQFSSWPSISVSSFIKLPSILLEICSRQKCNGWTDEQTDTQTDKAATICSPFGEHKNEETQSCHSCMQHSALTFSIILPSTIKIFLKVAKLSSGNKMLTPPLPLPARLLIILITRVFHWKTWSNTSILKKTCK